MEKWRNRKGETRFYPSLDEVRDMDENSEGACIGCGETGQSAEPDAERYECECCGKNLVFGSMWFAFRNNIKG